MDGKVGRHSTTVLLLGYFPVSKTSQGFQNKNALFPNAIGSNSLNAL
jgi:hypothetical protein